MQSIVPWLSRYADGLDAWKLEALYAQGEENWMRRAEGKFWLRAKLRTQDDPSIFLRAFEQRAAAQFVGRALQQKAEFLREEGCYRIGDWSVTNGSITSAPFGVNSRNQCLTILSGLDRMGYRLADAVGIHFRIKSMEPDRLRTLLTYAGGGELAQLREVFGLSGGPTVFLDAYGIEMILSMGEFRYDALEISLLMFDRLIRMSGLMRAKGAPCEPQLAP